MSLTHLVLYFALSLCVCVCVCVCAFRIHEPHTLSPVLLQFFYNIIIGIFLNKQLFSVYN